LSKNAKKKLKKLQRGSVLPSPPVHKPWKLDSAAKWSSAKKVVPQKFNLHLPRQQLRHLLFENLDPNTIEWNCCFIKYEQQTDGALVYFERPNAGIIVVKCRILVGCDGIHSCVRLQKQPAPLNYLGMLVVLGMCECTHPLTKRTTFQTLDGTTRLFTMPYTTTQTFWQLSFPCELTLAKQLQTNPMLLRQQCMERCSQWHEPVPQLIEQTPNDMITATPVYDRGQPYPYTNQTNEQIHKHQMDGQNRIDTVTLIGDAAHPMSPFKGNDIE
jgi:2-polyprenyl-6-methoxyphenol hydroxylase-like FAD-dependent oxidoreductase